MRSHLSYANVASTLCLFLVLAGGTAYALEGSNTVFSDDIVNTEVSAADIGQGQVGTGELVNQGVKTSDIGNGEVTSAKVANDDLTGADVAANSLKGADIDEATLQISGARAYAVVSGFSCAGEPPSCPPQQSQGVTGVIREGVGTYCVTAPGIDSGEVPAAVTVDWSTTSHSEGNASAMTGEGHGCGAGDRSFRVVTERQSPVSVTSGDTTYEVSGVASLANDVGFTIVIP